MLKAPFAAINKVVGKLLGRKSHGGGGWSSFFAGYGGSGASSTGMTVNAQTAMALADVYACNKILSESIGSMPIKVYRRVGANKEENRDSPLWPLLTKAPNKWQTAMDWFEGVVSQCNFRGNQYNRILRDRSQAVRQIIPYPADTVRMLATGLSDIFYECPKLDGGGMETLPAREILHFKHLPINGYLGITPIRHCVETFGLALAAQNYQSKVFGESARPGGLLSYPPVLSDTEREKRAASWRKAFSGPDNVGRVAVADGGATWTQLSLSNEDLQIIQLLDLLTRHICAIFRVPPHMLAMLKDATFSNVEHMGIEFVKFSLLPWMERLEQRMNLDLFVLESDGFCEFQADGLERGDFNSRYSAHSSSLQSGWKTVNEVRANENLNPIDGGDDLRVPLNTGPIDSAGGGSAAANP